jgi:HEAT repeat protein
VSALGDENEYVRGSACKAVAKMGEKAATNEVISKLVSALGDKSDYVRGSACEAVGQMGEKAATNEVISKLVSAYGNESEYVRANAYKALMKMGEKAATNEVISMLVSVLGDERNHFRRDACKALMKMGKKAATNEVISKLVSIVNTEFDESYSAAEAVGNILISSAMITRLDPNIVADLCLCKRASDCLKHVSEEEIIKFFFNAQNPDWVSAVTKITLLKGAAVTATEDKVVVHGSKGPVELSVPNLELSRQLIEAFTDQRKRVHLYFGMK